MNYQLSLKYVPCQSTDKLVALKKKCLTCLLPLLKLTQGMEIGTHYIKHARIQVFSERRKPVFWYILHSENFETFDVSWRNSLAPQFGLQWLIHEPTKILENSSSRKVVFTSQSQLAMKSGVHPPNCHLQIIFSCSNLRIVYLPSKIVHLQKQLFGAVLWKSCS